MRLFTYIKKVDDYFGKKDHAELFFKLIILMMLLLIPLMAAMVIKVMGDRAIMAAKISNKNYTAYSSGCSYSFSPTTVSVGGMVHVRVLQGAANHTYVVGITTTSGQLISTTSKMGKIPLAMNLKASGAAGSYLVAVRDDTTKNLCGGSPVLTVVAKTSASNCKYDLNYDGIVNDSDVQIALGYFGSTNLNYDYTGDGAVDISDALVVAQAAGAKCPSAKITSPTPVILQPTPSPKQ